MVNYLPLHCILAVCYHCVYIQCVPYMGKFWSGKTLVHKWANLNQLEGKILVNELRV